MNGFDAAITAAKVTTSECKRLGYEEWQEDVDPNGQIFEFYTPEAQAIYDRYLEQFSFNGSENGPIPNTGGIPISLGDNG